MKRSKFKYQISKTFWIPVFTGMTMLLFLFFIPPYSIFAAPNNKFGMSLAQPNTDQFIEVQKLVNSNGGDWGYITLIIQENDRDKNKWQRIFNQLRSLHLIPIIRLATRPEGENWRRPLPEDAQSWVDFLDSLNWVVKNRYIILFNEPNHGSEWGGEVDTKSFAKVTLEFAKKLKERSPDFFVMLAGMDASAPSWMPGMEDEEVFLRKILQGTSEGQTLSASQSLRSDLISFVDGLASHSYPNPAFSGSPYAVGRGTIRNYEWELELFKELGMSKELPVFITETGWSRAKIGESLSASYFQLAFDIWGNDKRIKAVTPFVFDYQSDPFLEFSWKKYNSEDFYQQYYIVQSLSKIKGEPEQIEKGWINFKLPTDLVVQSTYHFKVKLNNLGQAVWDKDSGYGLGVRGYEEKKPSYLFEDLKDISPFEEKDVYFTIKTNDEIGNKKIKFVLEKNDNIILSSQDWNINILPLPTLQFETNFFPFGAGRGDNYEIQIWDVDDQLVFKKKNINVNYKFGQVKDIQNIALDELYRVVLLKPYHLPRQEFIVFKKEINKMKFKSLLPFDFNNDGTFNFKDIISIFMK